MSLLTQAEVLKLIDALLQSGVDTVANRGALFQFINPTFRAGLPSGLPEPGQLLNDIGHMNRIERFANGDVPLEIYLANAVVLLAADETHQKVVRATLDTVTHRASGAPRVDPATVPETQEKLIHRDDTVTFAFMDAGVKAAAAVMKLRVPRFDNGQARQLNGHPMTYLGTGWLLSESLVMTNHHVINARGEGEPNASDADLALQSQAVELSSTSTARISEAPKSPRSNWRPGILRSTMRYCASRQAAARRCAARQRPS